jgi:hypothetical protein
MPLYLFNRAVADNAAVIQPAARGLSLQRYFVARCVPLTIASRADNCDTFGARRTFSVSMEMDEMMELMERA